MQNNMRDRAIDMMKGLAILLMLLGHQFQMPGYDEYIVPVIYSFHMPLFFIIAGYFFTFKYDFLQALKNDARRLLVPYFVTVGVICLYAFWTYYIRISNHDTANHMFMSVLFPSGNPLADGGPWWFLLAIFWSKTIFHILVKQKCIYVGICLSLLLSLVSIYNSDVLCKYLPLELCQGASAIIFFAFGYIVALHKPLLAKYKKAIFLLSLVMWILAMCFSGIFMSSAKFVNFPVALFGALGGTYCVYIFSQFLIRRLEGGQWSM